jgi:hypothetical protein
VTGVGEVEPARHRDDGHDLIVPECDDCCP